VHRKNLNEKINQTEQQFFTAKTHLKKTFIQKQEVKEGIEK
jgi:hypothetical protein